MEWNLEFIRNLLQRGDCFDWNFYFKETEVAFSTLKEFWLLLFLVSQHTHINEFTYMWQDMEGESKYSHAVPQQFFFYESKGDDAVMRWSGYGPTVGVVEICHLKLIWHRLQLRGKILQITLFSFVMRQTMRSGILVTEALSWMKYSLLARFQRYFTLPRPCLPVLC